MKTLKVYVILHFLVTCLTLNNHGAKMSIDYFNYRGTKTACLFICQQDSWSHDFTVTGMQYGIFTSVVVISQPRNKNVVMSCLKQTFWNLGVIIDSQCQYFAAIMYMASEEMLLDSNHLWMIINNDKENNETDHQSMNYTGPDFGEGRPNAIHLLDKLNISVDADIAVATENYADKSYYLHDIYNFGKNNGGEFNVVPMGKWSENDGLQVWLTGYKYQQRWDFRGFPMKMIVVSARPKLFRPELITTRIPNPDINIVTKSSATALDIVAEVHNFRFVYTATDRWISTFTPNSSRVAANSLYFREQDVTPLLRISTELFTKVDIVHPPLISVQTKYYYRIPNYGVGKLENQFLTPLSSGSWICVTGMSVICGLILILTSSLERRPSSAQYAIFTVIASICQQFFESNEDKAVKRISSARKVTVLVTGVSCLLLYNYYTSSVVSWLLSGPPPSINSLEELLNSPLELIFEDQGYCRSWLQTPSYYFNVRNAKIENELRAKKVFNKKKGAPLLMTLEQGVDMVKAGGYAFHAQVAAANARISQMFNKMELCELGSLQSMPKSELYPSVPKRSPYKEFFVWSLARLKERGHVSCIHGRLSSPDISCDGSVPRALALGGAAPAFILLALGYLLALGVLLGEVMVTAYWNSLQKKTKF